MIQGILINISIHAPVKGATEFDVSAFTALFDFNPRTREGCDVFKIHGQALQAFISIHAPVKGATSRISKASLSQYLFQSTHP